MSKKLLFMLNSYNNLPRSPLYIGGGMIFCSQSTLVDSIWGHVNLDEPQVQTGVCSDVRGEWKGRSTQWPRRRLNLKTFPWQSCYCFYHALILLYSKVPMNALLVQASGCRVNWSYHEVRVRQGARHYASLYYQQCGYHGYHWYETSVEFLSLAQNKVIHSSWICYVQPQNPQVLGNTPAW